MVRQHLYINTVVLFTVSVLISTCAWAGVDPVQFFTQAAPTIAQTLYSQPGHEAFLAQDHFGNPLQIKIDQPLSLFSEIGGSLLAQGLELPTIPSYPMFIQRNHDGTSPVWYRAMVQPQSASRSGVRSVAKLTSTQMGEWLGQMVFNRVIGNSNVLSHADALAVSGGHVITPDLSRAFQSYGNASQDPLSAYLDQIPHSVLKANLNGLSEKEAAAMFDQLNRYLSRLEKLEYSDVERLFGALFESKSSSGIDYRAEFNQRIHETRSQLLQYFKAHYPELTTAQTLSQPARAGRPVFHFPNYFKEVHPRSASHSGENGLWMHYFQDLSHRPHRPVNSINKLLQRARERKDIYYVGPTLSPEFFNTELNDPPQTHLNPKNSKTLIVVAGNDLEAKDIARIGRVSGAQVMELNGEVYVHGSKLTPALAAKVVQQAKKLGVETVAVVEMPGDPLNVEETFSQKGFKFLAIDHHAHSGLSRTQPYSSLEQAAQLLGYDLGGVSKVIEVKDRSFIAGLQDLGLSKKAVEQLFPATLEHKDLGRFVQLRSTPYGPFYIFSGHRGKFPELVSYLAMREWPNRPNVLMLGWSLKFSGDPKFREMLTNAFKEYDSLLKEHYLGGDAMRTQFWGISGYPSGYETLFNGIALKQVEAALNPLAVQGFKNALEERVKVPKSVFDLKKPETLTREGPVIQKVKVMPVQELRKILSLPTKERAEALSQVYWSELDEAGRDALLKSAAKARVFSETEQYLRIARKSFDKRWRSTLDQLSITFGNPRNKAEEKLLRDIVKVVNKLSDGCMIHEVEDRVKNLAPDGLEDEF